MSNNCSNTEKENQQFNSIEENKPSIKEQLYIYPVNNEKYHENMLNLLNISPDKQLSLLYYREVPQINKGQLMKFDWNGSQTNDFISSLLPDKLLNGCIFH